MPIKSFKGQITPGNTDTIHLSTRDGSIGYKIVKFQIINKTPHGVDSTLVAKIFSIPQTTATATIDFSDQTLLACAIYEDQAVKTSPPQGYEAVIFDNMVFNQDIYVTMADTDTNTDPGNYYIELEQIKLDLNENTVATLKDIRNIEAQ
jgi:hypothetical protein